MFKTHGHGDFAGSIVSRYGLLAGSQRLVTDVAVIPAAGAQGRSLPAGTGLPYLLISSQLIWLHGVSGLIPL